MKLFALCLVLAIIPQIIIRNSNDPDNIQPPTPPASGESTACADAATGGTARYLDPNIATGGNGTTWALAWKTTAAAETGATRGQTVCVADGALAGTTFNTAVSGTTPITFKKATVADHGSSTGWSDTMGDGQTTFSSELRFDSRYWIFDGAVGGFSNSCYTKTCWQTGHGFKVTETTSIPVIWVNSGGNVDIQHIEVVGGKPVDGGTGNDCLQETGTGGTNISYAYLHNCGRTVFYHGGSGNPLVASWVFTGDFESNGTEHAELAVMRSTAKLTFRWGVIIDVADGATGGFIAADELPRPQPSTLEYYGNVMYTASDFAPWGIDNNGIFGAFTVGSAMTNWRIYNNTFVSLAGNPSLLGITGEAPTGNVAANNYYYNSASGNTDFISGSAWTDSYSHCQNSGTCSAPNSTNSTSGNPFVNLTTYDFHLTAATAAGTTISSPYNVDMFGTVRGADGTWDRGAIEFCSGGC